MKNKEKSKRSVQEIIDSCRVNGWKTAYFNVAAIFESKDKSLIRIVLYDGRSVPATPEYE